MRKTIGLVLTVFVVGACARERAALRPQPTVALAPTMTPVSTPDGGEFAVSGALDHTHALSVDVGRREAGTAGDNRAADYIVGRLQSLGWRVVRQEFPLPQGGVSSNVIGTPPGFDEAKPYLLVGGHRDSLRGPGANDNATGVATALEIARALRARPAPLPVAFVAFGAEELQPIPGHHHHVGSRYYVQHMSPQARSNLVAFVNVDMVGWGTSIFCPRMISGPREGTQRCLRLAGTLGIRASERVTPDWSDNGSFLAQGMNAAWLWSGDDKCCNHSPRDTMARVQPASVERAGRLALAIIRSYTG